MLKEVTNNVYNSFLKTWQKMRDVFKGEEHIKDRSLAQNTNNLEGVDVLKPIKTFDQYLRPTDSMRRLGELGLQRFCDYIYRAKFYPFPLEIQSQSLGLIENQPASIELPTKMEGMLEDATLNNESLLKVLSLTNTEQLQVSRVGLLLTPSNELNKPFNIAMYKAESIVDFREEKSSETDRTFTWVKLKTDELEKKKPVYLILHLAENGVYSQYKTTDETVQPEDEFEKDNGYISGSFVSPMASESTFSKIPFVIVNASSLGGKFERPFLESVADASLSLFRASAHHEDALYWGGESTLFTKGYALGLDENGNQKSVFVGNGAVNTSNSDYADAKYATMGVDGIGPRKENEEKLFNYCVTLGVDLINKGTESGVALNIRSNVKTASLKTLSLTGALGLQTVLRFGAEWLNLNVDEVIVTANTTFADVVYTAEDFVKFSSLVNLGAMRPVDLFNLQKKNNLTTAETFEDWLEDLKTVKPE